MTPIDPITADNDSTLAGEHAARPMVSVTNAAGAVALTLVLAFGGGFAAAGKPVVQAPQACHEMADTATEIFELHTELVVAVKDRGDALDKDSYRVKDGQVNHLLASLEAIAPTYNEAEAACLGGVR